MVWLPPPRNDVKSTVTSQSIKEYPSQVQGVTSKQSKAPLHVESNNVSSDASQGENEAKLESQNASTNQNPANSQEVNDNKDLGAEKDIVRTSSLQESDNQSNNHAEDNSQTQTSQKLDLTKNSKKFAKKVLATNLIATSPMTNGGFDEATWGKLDVNNWQGSVQDGVYELTDYDYTGDPSHIIVPNEADFEKAGRSTNGLQVGIHSSILRRLLSNQKQITIAFSKTNNQKVKAIGTDWSYVFSSNTAHFSKFDGSSLDVSNVTDMNHMFYNSSISDLTSLSNWDSSKVTDMSGMFQSNSISDLTPLANWNVSKVTDMSLMFDENSISDLTPLAHWNTSKVTDMDWMFSSNSISDLTPLSNWDTSKVTNMSAMFAHNPDLIDLKPIANWNISDMSFFLGGLFYKDAKLDLTNINNTPLMQGFLKEPAALGHATFITNNADLVKATINKDPTLTNTAKRTITFNLPHATPETINQVIYYKAIPTVQVDFNNKEIVQTYPVKESDWQLDTSKQNDVIIVNGQIHFKAVKIPHINGYKAHLVRNKLNPAMFMVSFVAVPSENKPSTPVEVAPSKPSAPIDKPFAELDHKVVDDLNSNDSGWTMPNTQPATYTVEVPADDAIIDLSDLVIAEPVHAQTRTQIRVTKRFKLSKKHSIKHLKHRKRVSKLFSKHYALL